MPSVRKPTHHRVVSSRRRDGCDDAIRRPPRGRRTTSRPGGAARRLEAHRFECGRHIEHDMERPRLDRRGARTSWPARRPVRPPEPPRGRRRLGSERRGRHRATTPRGFPRSHRRPRRRRRRVKDRRRTVPLPREHRWTRPRPWPRSASRRQPARRDIALDPKEGIELVRAAIEHRDHQRVDVELTGHLRRTPAGLDLRVGRPGQDMSSSHGIPQPDQQLHRINGPVPEGRDGGIGEGAESLSTALLVVRVPCRVEAGILIVQEIRHDSVRRDRLAVDVHRARGRRSASNANGSTASTPAGLGCPAPPTSGSPARRSRRTVGRPPGCATRPSVAGSPTTRRTSSIRRRTAPGARA